jgi:hypothetical protein
VNAHKILVADECPLRYSRRQNVREPPLSELGDGDPAIPCGQSFFETRLQGTKLRHDFSTRLRGDGLTLSHSPNAANIDRADPQAISAPIDRSVPGSTSSGWHRCLLPSLATLKAILVATGPPTGEHQHH